MGSRYLTDLADVCRRTHFPVIEVDGWQTRARGSGGYDGGRPNHIMAHHTASPPSSDGWDDVNYCTFGDEDAPLCNLYISRVPEIFVCAGGATNTNGSGHDPCGATADDSMNSSAIGIEAANNGTGETWPDDMLDCYNALCRELCAAYGIPNHRIHGHVEWAPSRKIDPAGPPRYAAGGATWDMDHFRVDCADIIIIPPQPGEEDDMFDGFWRRENDDAVYAIYKNGTKVWMADGHMHARMVDLQRINGAPQDKLDTKVTDDPAMFMAMGVVVGPIPPGRDAYGNR